MTARGLPASQLGAQPIAEFICAQRACDQRRVPTVRSFLPLLDFLRGEGVLVPIEVTTPTPVETQIAEYRNWLVNERGLAAPTVLRYESLARRFLEERSAAVGSRFVDDLSGTEVVGFLLAETAWVSVGAAKGRVTDRSY